MVSKLYRTSVVFFPAHNEKLKSYWEWDLWRPITDKIWTAFCAKTRLVSPSHHHKLLHFKFQLHSFITPTDQHKYDPSRFSDCSKCHTSGADLLHMAWPFRYVTHYSGEIFSKLSQMLETDLDADRLLALLGYVLDLPKNTR